MRNISEIGKILEKARKDKNLSIFEVSSKTKMHEKVIEQIENGEAENSLSKVYIKSFIKKYASFLGISSDDLLDDYFNISEVESEQKIHLVSEDEKGEDSLEKIAKYMPAIGLILIGLIVILSLIAGVIKLTALFKTNSKKTTKIIEVKKNQKQTITKKIEPKNKQVAKKTNFVDVAKKIFSKSAKKDVSLILKSDEVVWIRVDQDGEVVFQGNLKPNLNEKWIANKQINVRVGNLKVLELTVNGQYYGNVGFGVKDLLIDNNGLLIDSERYIPKDHNT